MSLLHSPYYDSGVLRTGAQANVFLMIAFRASSKIKKIKVIIIRVFQAITFTVPVRSELTVENEYEYSEYEYEYFLYEYFEYEYFEYE